jgi:hypothetical protein
MTGECSDKGLGALLEKLPQKSLKRLSWGVQASPAGVEKLAQFLPPGLTALDLKFGGKFRLHRPFDKVFTESDVGVLAAKLPEGLTQLRLDFSYLVLGDSGLLVLAEHFPATLQELTLDLSNCRITETGAVGLAKKLSALTALRSLSLDFSFCKICSGGVAAIAKSAPPLLENVHLDCTYSGVNASSAASAEAALKLHGVELTSRW